MFFESFIFGIFNIFFTNSFNSSLRVVKIIFIILFIIEALRIFDKYHFEQLKNIFMIWSVIFLVIIIDCLFEIIFGFNLTGNKSIMQGRIASFFGEELVVGAFVHGFALFALSFLIYQCKKNYIFFLSVLLILIISFLIGERSNFIKLFICISLFLFITTKANYFNKILILLSSIGIILIFLNFNDNLKIRYYDQLSSLFEKNGIKKFYKNSQYGAHKNAALNILKEYPYFGVGIKNFRYESKKPKYFNREYLATDARHSTHPHQIHLNFYLKLDYLVIFPFLIFILSSLIISIKNYYNNRNIFHLSGIIFVFSILIPLRPLGVFYQHLIVEFFGPTLLS